MLLEQMERENNELRRALKNLIEASDGHWASLEQRNWARHVLSFSFQPVPFIAMNTGGINKAPE